MKLLLSHTSKYPIILIHTGASAYLLDVIQQAYIQNSDTKIILIGDEKNQNYPANKHYYLSDFLTADKKIRKVYQHFAENSYEYELFCIKRWFVLLDRMKREKIEHCFYMDSDVLLYCNVNKESIRWNNYELAYAAISGHSIFINSVEGLEKFCNFIIDQYLHHLNEIKEDYIFISHINNHWGISDMYFFSKYRGIMKDKIGNIQESNGSVFDENIGESNGYKRKYGIKEIIVNKDGMYAYKDKTLIKFNSLHFQGRYKYFFIKDFIIGKLGFIFWLKVRIIEKVIVSYVFPWLMPLRKKLHLRKNNLL